MSLLFPLLIALGGLVLYLSNDGKLSQVGLYAYAIGLLAFLLQAGPQLTAFLGR